MWFRLNDAKTSSEVSGLKEFVSHLLLGGVRWEVQDVEACVSHREFLHPWPSIHTLDHHAHLLKPVYWDVICSSEEDWRRGGGGGGGGGGKGGAVVEEEEEVVWRKGEGDL